MSLQVSSAAVLDAAGSAAATDAKQVKIVRLSLLLSQSATELWKVSLDEDEVTGLLAGDVRLQDLKDQLADIDDPDYSLGEGVAEMVESYNKQITVFSTELEDAKLEANGVVKEELNTLLREFTAAVGNSN